MQCISCEKCKMFGTLQILGMGTALRILLDPDVDLIIERNEIIVMKISLFFSFFLILFLILGLNKYYSPIFQFH